MAENFDNLSAMVDRCVSLITDAITIITNPATDNNNQDVIDALTLRLQGAADALAAVEPVVAPAPVKEEPAAPVSDPAPEETPVEDAPVSDTSDAPAASADASTDAPAE